MPGDRILAVLKETVTALEKLEPQIRDRDCRTAFDAMLKQFEEYSGLIAQYIDQQVNMGSLREQVSRLVFSLQEQAAKLSASGTAAVQETNSMVNGVVLGVTLLALLLGIGVALYISTSVHRQLGVDPGELAVLADSCGRWGFRRRRRFCTYWCVR